MEPIIKSVLDLDQYKLSMQQAVLELYPDTIVEYRFKNRGEQRFTDEFLKELRNQINMLANLSLSQDEYIWIKSNIPFFKPQYVEYLKNYRFNPDQVEISLDEENNLQLSIKGTWRETILFETILLSLISELYFDIVEKNWDRDIVKIQTNAYNKIKRLSDNNCIFTDFGSRRRRSFKVQDEVVGVFKRYQDALNKRCFQGSSNMFLAKKYGIKAIGTMAHEFFMGISVLEGLRHVNYYTLHNWVRVYGVDLGIALSDTYGSDVFFENFNKRFSKLYDGVRWDSGDWKTFTDKTVAHYNRMGIDPLSKIIIFSDNLDVDTVIKINEYCNGKIRCSFGVGTHLTNHGFLNSPPLNMVIKLWSVRDRGRDVPVVKLSDSPGKIMGDRDSIRVAMLTFFGTPLDANP